jgi:hypothetical protein
LTSTEAQLKILPIQPKKNPIQQGHFVGQRSNQINNDIRDFSETATYMKGKRRIKKTKREKERSKQNRETYLILRFSIDRNLEE